MKKQYKVGDKAKALTNNRYWFIGEIIAIYNNTAVIAVPVYFSNVVDYITVESLLDDLLEIKKDIKDFKNIH